MSESVMQKLVRRVGAEQLMASMTPQEWLVAEYHWPLWARPEQLPPPGDWSTWVFLAGRSTGKTRSAAEWLIDKALRYPGAFLCAMGATVDETRKVMVDGESGLRRRCAPWVRTHWNTLDSTLDLANGSRIYTLTAENPDQPRGYQFHFAWCDEIAKWRYGREAWDNLSMTLRLGKHPQCCVTTTPRPLTLLRDIIKQPSTVITHGRTRDNSANLPASWIKQMEDAYGGTRLGAQELEGVLFDESDGALWAMKWIDDNRIACSMKSPSSVWEWLERHGKKLERIVIGLDPSTTSNERSDECGISVAGKYSEGDVSHAVVLHDGTAKLSPLAWAREVVKLYHLWSADLVVAETTMGGETIRGMIESIDDSVNVKEKGGCRGKRTRAEPVAALYERGRVHHLGVHEKLENEMATFTLDMNVKTSPNSMDAMVYSVGELLLSSGFFIPP